VYYPFNFADPHRTFREDISELGARQRRMCNFEQPHGIATAYKEIESEMFGPLPRTASLLTVFGPGESHSRPNFLAATHHGEAG
jgi:hypothetical protein